MGLILVLIFGVLVFDTIGNDSKTAKEKKKTIQVISNKKLQELTPVLEAKPEPKNLELPKEEIILESKKAEPLKEEAMAESKKVELLKEEVKVKINKSEIAEEETKPQKLDTASINENSKPDLKNQQVKLEPTQEKIKEIDDVEQPGTSWLKLILYILGPILIVVTGKYFFTRQHNKTTLKTTPNLFRENLKKEIQTDTTEDQPVQEEVQTEATEDQPAQEEVQAETTEDQPVQEEVQAETTEDQPVQEEVQTETTEDQPAQEEVQTDTTEDQPAPEDDNKIK